MPGTFQSAGHLVVGLLGLEPGATVLDLCCGIGRHSIELARLGYLVTALDRTQAYLDRASARAREEGLAVEFVRADMREFCRKDAFDAAINLYTSFGYFEDIEEDRRVARNVYRSLVPGGVPYDQAARRLVVVAQKGKLPIES